MNIPKIQNDVRSKWMECPKSNTQYPGLAYIEPLAELIAVKQTDKLHKLIGRGKSYTIYNIEEEKVFLAVEEKIKSNFEIKIYNFYGNEVIRVKQKPFKLCRSKALVWAPPGNLVGTVKEVHCCVNKFVVENSDGKKVLKITDDPNNQDVYNIIADHKKIGVISNDWYSGADCRCHFGIAFPINMNICDKAVLIGACFLIGCLKF